MLFESKDGEILPNFYAKLTKGYKKVGWLDKEADLATETNQICDILLGEKEGLVWCVKVVAGIQNTQNFISWYLVSQYPAASTPQVLPKQMPVTIMQD